MLVEVLVAAFALSAVSERAVDVEVDVDVEVAVESGREALDPVGPNEVTMKIAVPERVPSTNIHAALETL